MTEHATHTTHTTHGNGLPGASLILGLSLIVCTILAGRTFVKVRGFGQTITVTGAANKQISSDYAVWEGWIRASAPDLESAYARLSQDRETTESYLQEHGFAPDMYDVGSVSIIKDFDRDRILTGYTLHQTIKVELPDVGRITTLAKEISSLIEKGVELDAGRPRYLFTGLDNLKVEMIRAATENAKLRAAQLAETAGRRVGSPVSARVGVFQIRPLHSQDVSGMGMSDVSSVEKEIVSTVHIDFLFED